MNERITTNRSTKVIAIVVFIVAFLIGFIQINAMQEAGQADNLGMWYRVYSSIVYAAPWTLIAVGISVLTMRALLAMQRLTTRSTPDRPKGGRPAS